MELSPKPDLVTVVVPTYNRAHYLTEAIASVFAQDYRPIELIIVDDGSTDNTGEDVDRWIARNNSPGFQAIYVHQENQGAPVARNLGLAGSHGEFVVMFDSDDLMGPNRIARVVAELKSTKADIGFSGVNYLERCSIYTPPQASVDPLLDFLLGRIHGGTQSTTFRRSILFAVGGYDEELVCHQDLDLTFRCLAVSQRVCFAPSVTTYFRKPEGKRVSDLGITEAGFLSMLKSHQRRLRYFCNMHADAGYIGIEAKILLLYAISCYAKGYHETSCQFYREAQPFLRRISWGPEERIMKHLFLVGGVSLCGTIKRWHNKLLYG